MIIPVTIAMAVALCAMSTTLVLAAVVRSGQVDVQ